MYQSITDESRLLRATQHGREASVKKYLDRGVDIECKDFWDQKTPLMVAAAGGHKEIVDLFLARGANINAVDLWGFNALYLAALHAHVSIVQCLVEAGADIHHQNSQGSTVLHCVCTEIKDAVYFQNLYPGKDEIYLRYLFHHLFQRNEHYKAIFDLLVKADASLRIEDNRGKTPLDYLPKGFKLEKDFFKKPTL